MTEAISPSTFPYTQPTVHPSITTFVSDCIATSLWTEVRPLHPATDYPEAVYQNYVQIQLGRIVQIVNLLEGYLPREGICGALISLLHLIWNAVKAIFGCSDFQKACSLFKNHSEEAISFFMSEPVMSNYIKYSLEHFQQTPETQQLLQGLQDTDEAVKTIATHISQEHIHLTQADRAEVAHLSCLFFLTTATAQWEYCVRMPAERQEALQQVLQDPTTILSKLSRIEGPVQSIILINTMERLMSMFSESSPEDLMCLLNCQVWQSQDLSRLEQIVVAMEEINRAAPEGQPLSDNPQIHALFTDPEYEQDEIVCALSEIFHQSQPEIVQDLTAAFYALYTVREILPHLSHFMQISDEDPSPLADRAALEQKIRDMVNTIPTKTLQDVVPLDIQVTEMVCRMSPASAYETVDRYFTR